MLPVLLYAALALLGVVCFSTMLSFHRSSGHATAIRVGDWSDAVPRGRLVFNTFVIFVLAMIVTVTKL